MGYWKIWDKGIALNEGGNWMCFTCSWKERFFVYLSIGHHKIGFIRLHN